MFILDLKWRRIFCAIFIVLICFIKVQSMDFYKTPIYQHFTVLIKPKSPKICENAILLYTDFGHFLFSP